MDVFVSSQPNGLNPIINHLWSVLVSFTCSSPGQTITAIKCSQSHEGKQTTVPNDTSNIVIWKNPNRPCIVYYIFCATSI